MGLLHSLIPVLDLWKSRGWGGQQIKFEFGIREEKNKCLEKKKIKTPLQNEQKSTSWQEFPEKTNNKQPSSRERGLSSDDRKTENLT